MTTNKSAHAAAAHRLPPHNDSERIWWRRPHSDSLSPVGQLRGLAGPYVIGFLNDRTHSLTTNFGFIALVHVAAAGLISCLRIPDPVQALENSNSA